MDRLTKKGTEHGPYRDEYLIARHNVYIDEILNKLGKLEDIEEEIDCPLDVLIKSQREGFYGKMSSLVYFDPLENFIILDFKLQRLQCAVNHNFNDVITYYFGDYKKTWWLKSDQTE